MELLSHILHIQVIQVKASIQLCGPVCHSETMCSSTFCLWKECVDSLSCIFQQARLDVPFTGCSKEHKDSAQRESSPEHCPAVSEKHNQAMRMSLKSIPSPCSPPILIEPRHLCSLSGPFHYLSFWHHHKTSCTQSMWPSSLWRSVHFLGWRLSTQRAAMHTLIFPSDSKYFALLEKEWKSLSLWGCAVCWKMWKHAFEKIQNNDILMYFSCSCVI